ncbi:hypothetical protein CHH28_13245 [Bacterioplanes sanyensis]|uniref:Response regulatory domain-containing protein n=1 Tax=Bacterioplanes sanyensis TaxID=1249553 RepID=A0A222FMY4_9GAMM|nr:response regulator [Bacterioplanes sanyensis]ASP39583.1 hypothetical protein CHH28_13245 [Bacterioplanes sanyensis]
MFRSIHHKLAQRMALHVSVLLLIIALVLSAFSLFQSAQQLRQQLFQTPHQLLQTSLPTFDLATFNYNDRLNQQLTDGLIQHPAVLSVSVLDNTGREVAHSSRTQACQINTVEYAIFDVEDIHLAALNHRGNDIGQVILRADPCLFVQEFRRTAIHAALYTLLLCVIVSGFIYISHDRLLTRPLQRLAQRAEGINGHTIDSQALAQFHSDRPDELGQLSRSFYRLLEALTQHIHKQQQAEAQVADYSAKLEQLVQRRSHALSEVSRQLDPPTQTANDAITQARKLLLDTALTQLGTSASDVDLVSLQLHLQQARELDHIPQLSRAMDHEERLSLWLQRVLSQEGLYPSVVTHIEADEDPVLLAEELTIWLLVKLTACIRAVSSAPIQLTVRIRPQGDDQQLCFKLCSQAQAVPAELIDSELISTPHGLIPGLKVHRQLLATHQRQLSISYEPELELAWQLPCQHQKALLNAVRRHHPQALQLIINSALQRSKLQSSLDAWQLPYQFGDHPDVGSITLTDDATLAGQRNVLLLGHPDTGLPANWVSAQLLLALSNLCQGSQEQIGRRALVAEDNTISRMLCQRFLKNLGIQTELVDNGLQALEKARQQHFDVILMDCQMPIMDGFEATRQIRRDSLNQATPIMALTGLSGEDERQACLGAGMNDFIGKPFTQTQIQSTLLQWLDSPAA